MKINFKELSELLLEKNFTSFDVDSPKLSFEVLQFLADQNFFGLLYTEMVNVEQEKTKPRNAGEYKEKIGEF